MFLGIFSRIVLPMILLAVLGAGCSSRNIYQKQPAYLTNPSQEIIRREWVYPIEPLSSVLNGGAMEYAPPSLSPILEENLLMFGSSRFGMIALYPNLLRVRWKLENTHGVVSPIEIKDHVAYFTDGEGSLSAVSVDTGKKVWSYALRNPVTSKPTVEGKDLFIVTSDDAVISLESQTGKWQWHYRRRNTSGPSIHGAAAPLVIGEMVWAGFSDGALVALTRKEGKVMWEKQLSTNKRFADVNANFVMHDEHVLVPAYDGSLYNLNVKTGATLWAKENLGGSRGVEISNGVVYVASSQGYAYALDEQTGNEMWKFELDHPVAAGVTVLEKHILVASSSQYLYVLDRSSGKLADRIDIGYGSGFAGPFTYDSARKFLYGLSRGGNLLSFKYLK